LLTRKVEELISMDGWLTKTVILLTNLVELGSIEDNLKMETSRDFTIITVRDLTSRM
jgi:hypothetical protein